MVNRSHCARCRVFIVMLSRQFLRVSVQRRATRPTHPPHSKLRKKKFGINSQLPRFSVSGGMDIYDAPWSTPAHVSADMKERDLPIAVLPNSEVGWQSATSRDT